MVDVSIVDESYWRSIDGALTYDRKIYVLMVFRSRVASIFDDNPEYHHFAVLKNAEFVTGDIVCPAMESQIRKYVAGCELYNRMKEPCHTRDSHKSVV
jgi:hypothetical protein